MNDCPEELWFPARLYSLACVIEYIEKRCYKEAMYHCQEQDDWIVCRRIETYTEMPLPEQSPAQDTSKTLKDLLARI